MLLSTLIIAINGDYFNVEQKDPKENDCFIWIKELGEEFEELKK